MNEQQNSLPDINQETFPFEEVQRLLDQAAHFNLLSTPQPSLDARITDHGDVVGVRVAEDLHRLSIRTELPGGQGGFKVANAVGPTEGSFHHRWMFIPDGYDALPDHEPPRTALDPSRSQRFVMLGGTCRVGTEGDGFHGFGTGLTLPVTLGGRPQLQVAAVGTLTEGFGKLAGHTGTYTYCGTLAPDRGFVGSLLIRVMDHQGDLRTEDELPAVAPIHSPDPDYTYLLFRGQKRDRSQRTEYSFGSDGQVEGLDVEQQLRLLTLDSALDCGLRAAAEVGPVAGKITAKIRFNLLAPGAPGTDLSPIPFQSYNTYIVTDQQGETLGTIEADGGEGRTFALSLDGAPGQRALRFGGFGPIVRGTGIFEGAQGLMTDNSVVGIAPHALATQYVLRVFDPEGRFRAALDGYDG